MAVFWFGWAKKLKNIFTKQQADTYYLQKELPNQLQIVKGSVDFHKNVVIKQQGYVDRVDTNSNTAIPNKKYVDDKVLNALQLQTELYHSPENVKYSNIQKINVNLFDNANLSEYDPLIVSFDRYNGNDYQGTFTFTVQQNPYSPNNSNPSYGCYTQMFYNKNTTHMEIGQMCGLRITKTYIEVSCWNQNDRIANIIVIGRDSGRI